MNEEIDIIELLQRVKEGKAPKRIKWVDTDTIFEYNPKWQNISYMYRKEDNNECLMAIDLATLKKEIKILDKPQNQIIEELDGKEINWLVKSSENEHIPERERMIINCMVELYNAVEEIIDNINKGE